MPLSKGISLRKFFGDLYLKTESPLPVDAFLQLWSAALEQNRPLAGIDQPIIFSGAIAIGATQDLFVVPVGKFSYLLGFDTFPNVLHDFQIIAGVQEIYRNAALPNTLNSPIIPFGGIRANSPGITWRYKNEDGIGVSTTVNLFIGLSDV